MALPIRRTRVPAQRTGGWLSRLDPFVEIQDLWDQLEQMFEPSGEGAVAAWRPLAETEETSDAYVVRAELPGLKRDDIQVDIDGNQLTVHGEVDEQDKDGKALRRRCGRFVYRTILPNDVDVEHVDGQLQDGVLTIRVPKTEQSRARRVEIKG